MRIDVIVGLTASGLIHAGLFLGGIICPNHPPLKKPAEILSVVRLDMPQFVPDPPERIETSTDDVKPIPVAVPVQQDLPQVRTDTDFIQPVQPTPPETDFKHSQILKIPDGSRNPEISRPPVFDPSMLDQQPVARVKTPPPYPSEERRNGDTGTVIVDFIVDTDGNVANASAIKGDNRNFEQAAVQAVGKWKFKPGRKANRAVNTHMQIPIVFSLSE